MKTISNGHYTLEKKIGEGSFASVYLGKECATLTTVAIKSISKEHLNESQLERVHREVNLIKELDHPFIVSFYDIVEDDKNLYIVMENVEHGNILDFVNNHGELSEDEAKHYFCQLISALDYLHNEKHIVHRDLKAENIMLDRYNNIRLIDFGLSNLFSTENPFLTTACGSPAYACPEMIKGEHYDLAADIWSAGILLYAMCDCELPFQDENAQRLLQKIIYTEPKYPSLWTPQLRDLLIRMLNKNPHNRITLDQIKKHPWISEAPLNYVMDSTFGIDQSWRLSEVPPSEKLIDQAIFQHMISLGFDPKILVPSILGNNISGDPELVYPLSVYKILKREKTKEEMKQISFSYINYTMNQAHHHRSLPDKQTRPQFSQERMPFVISSPPSHVHSLPNTFGKLPSRKDQYKCPHKTQIERPVNESFKSEIPSLPSPYQPIKTDIIQPSRICRMVDRSGPSIQSNPNFITPYSPVISKPSPLCQKRTIFGTARRKSSTVSKKSKLDPILF